MAIAGDSRVRCRKCEGFLSVPQKVKPSSFGIVENKYGAAVRKCMNDSCSQYYLSFMQELPNFQTKIILKMIDKPV